MDETKTDATLDVAEDAVRLTVTIDLKPEPIYSNDSRYDEDGDPIGSVIDNQPTLREAVVVAAAAELLRPIRENVIRDVRSAIDGQIRDLVGDIVRDAVTSILETGWRRTNAWGEPHGETVTLRSRVMELIEEKVEVGDYNHRRKITKADQAIEAAVEAALKGEFAKEVEVARQRFRESLDAQVLAKLSEILRGMFR